MQKYVDFIQLKIIKLSFIFLILILQSSCSLPFRLKAELIRGPSQTSKTFSNCATAETLIENVHAESIEEEVFKLSNAKTQLFFAIIIRSRSSLGDVRKGTADGSISARISLTSVLFADPCSP